MLFRLELVRGVLLPVNVIRAKPENMCRMDLASYVIELKVLWRTK